MSYEHGEKLQYNSKWKGPLKGRSCTDCLCLFIFLAFIGGWAGVGYYAYTKGDWTAILTPVDSEGRRCGVDIPDKKYLVFFDLTKCVNIVAAATGCKTPQVCVEKCPTDNFFWDIDVTQKNIATLSDTILCTIDINKKNVTKEELERHVKNDVCARWYLKSTDVHGRCIPETIPSSFLSYNNFTMTMNKLIDTRKFTNLLLEVFDDLKHGYDAVLTTRWTILALMGCGGVVSVFYILLMRWLATPVVFISIVAVSGLLGYSTYFFYGLYADRNHSTFWLVLTIISGLMLVIIVLVCIFLRNRIRLACRLIGEASKAVTCATSTLVFPVIPWALQMAVAGYALVVGVYLFTLRIQTYAVRLEGNCTCLEALNYRNGSSCLPEVFNSICTGSESSCVSSGCYLNGTARPWFSNYMQAFNIVGLLWLLFFISAFGEMVLAGTFATWYWTFKKSDIPFFALTVSMWRTIRYHLGTLAFGSFIITVCRLIRLVLEYVDSKLKKYDNELVKFLLKCMRCYFWLLEKFLKFMNKNAYIMCAIHGKCFCLSAKSAFSLLMRNILRVVVIDKITDWLLFLGKILVTGLVTWLAWWNIKSEFPTLTYFPVPVTLVAIGTYLIASVFFSVYSMAVDTLFLCFLEDSERNDGTADKPYYMSKGLLNILRKS